MFKVLRNGLLRYILYTCPFLISWWRKNARKKLSKIPACGHISERGNGDGKLVKQAIPVVLFCTQRQYKLYLSCIPCLCHVLHAMPCLCAYLFLVIGSLAGCCPVGGWGGSRPCEQAAASFAVLLFFPPALPGFESGGGSWCTSEVNFVYPPGGVLGLSPCCCGVLALACGLGHPGCLSKGGKSLLQTSPLLLGVVAWIC